MNFYKDTAPTVLTNTGDKVRMNDIALNSNAIPQMINDGARNLFNLRDGIFSGAAYTMTFTKTGSSSFIINGTCSASDSWYETLGEVTLPAGEWKLVGTNTGSTNNFYLYAEEDDSWTTYGSANTVTKLTSEQKRTIRMRIKGGTTLNNVEVHVMVILNDYIKISNAITPYSPTNIDLFNRLPYRARAEFSSGAATFPNIIRKVAKVTGYQDSDTVAFQFCVWSDVHGELLMDVGMFKYNALYTNNWVVDKSGLGCSVGLDGTVSLNGFTGTVAYISVTVF